MRNFQVLTVPSSLLAVVDASESMNLVAADGQTRMDFAVNAALTALDAFPGHARIGLWGFSTEQRGGPGLARARAAASSRRPGRGRRQAASSSCASSPSCCPP